MGGRAWDGREWPVNYFDGPIAATYDDDSGAMFDPAVIAVTVDFLADLAGASGALELAIGTGRIGLPLSQRGIRVYGIDVSPDMVAQLQKKPGSEDIAVVIGDFTDTAVGETFGLVYLVYNTIENVTTQEQQVDCFRNAARHLDPGGVFVIEVEVPQLQHFPPGQTTRVFTHTTDRLGFDEMDFAAQRGVSHHHWISDGSRHVFSMPYRYVWPSELDLMARIAGLQLRERWGGWDRRPFTSQSWTHVSVWQKPE
jgi:SAM-dependent methyltransferase